MRHLRLAALLATALLPALPMPAHADGDAFPATDGTSLGLSLDAGHKRYGNQLGAQLALRWHGAILGGTWSRLTEGPEVTGPTTALGVVAGYGHAFSGWRVEGTAGWGTVKADTGFGSFTGRALVGRLGLDRRLFGDDAWVITAGVGAWYQRITLLGASSLNWNEVGYGLRLGGELRL